MTRTLRAKICIPLVAGATALALVAAAVPASAANNKNKNKNKSVKLIVEKPPTATITEAGSSLLYPLWNLWAPGYNQTYPQVTLNTAAGGSGKGIAGATDGTLQIGSSDAYLSTADKQANQTLLNIPLAISAQEVFYNLTGVKAHLKLSGKVLAKMYEGKITTWDTSAIAKANPGVTLPKIPVVAMHRADSSGDTFLFTSYLSAATSTWGTSIGFNTSVTWPAAKGALAETGNSGMVAGCKTTPGCVAYIGISYQTQALGGGLTYGQLQNGVGQYVMPTAKSIQKEASGFTKKTPATGAISMIYGKVKGGYPIINYEYGIVSKKQSSSSEGKAVRSVLQWAINPKYGNSATYLSQVGFRPLPTKVVQQSFTQIKKIK